MSFMVLRRAAQIPVIISNMSLDIVSNGNLNRNP